MNRGVINRQECEKFRRKYSQIKKLVKKYVYENAAICDQVFQMQEKIIGAKEERNYLAKRLSQYIPPAEKMELPMPPKPAAVATHKKRESVNDKSKPKTPRVSAQQKRKRASTSTPTTPAPPPPPPLPAFPVKLGTLKIHSLGEIVTDRPGFHTEDVVYPVGFFSTRVYGSLSDPSRPCCYTCMILDAGTTPLFQISSEFPQEAAISGVNINQVHSQLLQRINVQVGAEVVTTRGRGADFFGLTHPQVQSFLNNMPAIHKCVNYKPKTVDMLTQLDDGGPSVKFDNLQRCIMFTKSQMETMRQQETLDSTTTLRDLLNS